MKLFSLGPVETFPHTLEVRSKQIPYFRTPEFSEIMLESEMLLKKAVGVSSDAKTVFLTASGTGAMEATVINCLTKDDRVLIINGGIFGKRFVEICQLHRIPYDEILLSFGEILTAGHFEQFENKSYSVLLVNIHETSTGQLYSIDIISSFCHRNNLLLIVDAISSFLADPYEMEKYGIDATILSTQKGLAVAPGMSLVILSNRMYEKRVCMVDCPIMYFDFESHISNQKRGQTPFTPAVGTALEVHDMLKHIETEGMQSRLEKIQRVAVHFRAGVQELGVKLPSYPLSNACTPLLFEDGQATFVYETLKTQYDMVLTPCGGELKDLMVRVGHIGNHSLEDNQMLLDALKYVLSCKK